MSDCVWNGNDSLKMATYTGFINIQSTDTIMNKSKLLITMLKWDKTIVKRYLFLALITAIVFMTSSCRTCKCPAYSQTDQPENQLISELSANGIQTGATNWSSQVYCDLPTSRLNRNWDQNGLKTHNLPVSGFIFIQIKSFCEAKKTVQNI